MVSLQFSSLRQTAELLFRWKTKLWTIAGLSSLCIFFANCRRFNFIAGVSLGFLEGFHDLRPNLLVKQRLMVLLLIL